MNDKADQIEICLKYGSKYTPVVLDDKAGVAANISSGLLPINGLRHLPIRGTSGWYIWAGGEIGLGDDFFDPVHQVHFSELFPDLVKYLALAPGWRFQVAPDYEDVWYDESLLVE